MIDGDVLNRLDRLARLYDEGAIDAQEFEFQKARLLERAVGPQGDPLSLGASRSAGANRGQGHKIALGIGLGLLIILTLAILSVGPTSSDDFGLPVLFGLWLVPHSTWLLATKKVPPTFPALALGGVMLSFVILWAASSQGDVADTSNTASSSGAASEENSGVSAPKIGDDAQSDSAARPATAELSCRIQASEAPLIACLGQSEFAAGGSLKIRAGGDVREYSEADIVQEFSSGRAKVRITPDFEIIAQPNSTEGVALRLEVRSASGQLLYSDEAGPLGVVNYSN